MLYDASGLVFSGTNNSQTFGNFSYHATGTYDWNPVTNMGVLDISVPFVNLSSWFNTPGSTFEYSSTSFHFFTPNSGTINGDLALTFASPLGPAQDAVSGTFQFQNDFAAYDYVGTVSGYLAPIVTVPEPSISVLLLTGVFLAMVLRATRGGRIALFRT